MRAVLVAILLCASVLLGATDSLLVTGPRSKSLVGVWWSSQKISDRKTATPVTVWFHGGMTSGNCGKGLVAGDDFARLFPDHVVVSASACGQNHWAAPSMEGIVDAALDSVAHRLAHPVESVNLVGVSDGALGVIVYSASGKRRANRRLLISSYGASLGEASRIAQLKELQTGRWRFLQGGSDRLYPSGKTLPWIEEFCRNVKVDCDLKYDPAGEHDWSYWKNNHFPWIKEAILP